MNEQNKELIRLLPYEIRDKYRHYRDYVHDRLVDIAMEQQMLDRVAKVEERADLVFLLRLLQGYFVIGFRNYDQMLGYLQGKQVDGFQIGGTEFRRNSPITIQWQAIASELESIINRSTLRQYLQPFLSVDDVIRSLLQSAQDST